MEQVLVEEEVKRTAAERETKKEENSSQKKTANALKEVFKEIKKAIKKEKRKAKPDSEDSIDTKVKKGEHSKKKNDLRQYGIDPEEHQQIDYGKLFDYLENLKVNQYQESSEEYNTDEKRIDSSNELREQAKEFIEQQKMDKIIGNNRDYELSSKSEAYFWFKLVHGKGVTELFYDLSFS